MSILPSGHELALTLQSLSRSKRRVILALGLIFVATIIGILWQVNLAYSEYVPTSGGRLTEGVIGAPRFVNPLLATTDADQDLVALIYSGLVRVNADNQFIPDLAERWEISENGRVYTFYLRPDLKWHDGRAITTADVEFTILKTQDPLVKSPRRPQWEGIQVETRNEREIILTLPQSQPSFLERVTLGILPQHLWADFGPDTLSVNQYNIKPVGSGPYQVKKIATDNLGIATYYDLKAFKHFSLGKPLIETVRLRFYPNEESLSNAYRRNEVESFRAPAGTLAKELESLGHQLTKSPLPRVFGLFFNQNKATIFAHQEVREALNTAIDRQEIINSALNGFGEPARSTLPYLSNGKMTETTNDDTDRIEKAQNILRARGWKWNETTNVWQKEVDKATINLAFVITTSDTPELKATAEILKADWERLGAEVELKIFQASDLENNVIRPREYEALLFGLIIGRTPELYPFWHSGERKAPGLNIASYTNSRVDRLLEEARATNDPDQRRQNYELINEEINKDVAAIFIYSPHFLYANSAKVKNLNLPTINTFSDRFLNIHTWYIETDRIWKPFLNISN